MRILLYFRQNITHQYDVRIELKFIALDRAMTCIQMARKDSPKSGLEQKIEEDLNRLFPERVRQNQLQWANMVLAQKDAP